GAEFFDWMRRQLQSLSMDVVLIDSRTGMTEMGGVCTRHLADIVVSFCTPNVKTLETMLTVTKSFRPEERPGLTQVRARRDLRTVIVPSRVELSDVTERQKFEIDFPKKSADFLPKQFSDLNIAFWNLKVPYVGYYTYHEQIALGGPGSELAEAYVRLAAHL